MKKENKNYLKRIISNLIIIVLIYSLSIWLKSVKSYKEELDEAMYKDLRNFTWMIEGLNEDIVNILIYKDREIDSYNSFDLNNTEISNLMLSNITAYSLSSRKTNLSYNYLDDVYWRVDKNIKNIIEDNYVDDKEGSYLRTLYNYNIELMKLYNEFSDEKKITNMYSKFNQSADEILNTKEYTSLKTFGFKNIDSNQAKKICEDIFKIIILADNKDQYILKFKEQNDEYYEFEGERVNKDLNENNILVDIKYKISYNIEEGSIYIRPNYSSEKYNKAVNDTKINLSESEIDKIANQIVTKFYGEDMVNYYKELLTHTIDRIDEEELKIFEEEKFRGVSYKFIGRQDDIYDKRKKVDLEINENGIIKSFSMNITNYNEKISISEINKEEILSKLNKDFIVRDSVLVINTDGKLEYEVLGEYNKSMYTIVFDVETGNQKDFYRGLIEYNQTIKKKKGLLLDL